MRSRRRLLTHLGGLSVVALAASLDGGLRKAVLPSARAADYKALVCIHLNGGNDGNDTLVPTDGAYDDYARGHGELALARDSLVALAGSSAGHSFGIHPGLRDLAPLYAQHRLAFVANVGPLVRPVSAAEVIAHAAEVPPFLLSHSDQKSVIQGWGGDLDASGWGGRALESMPGELTGSMPAIALTSNQTLVMGRHTSVVRMFAGGNRYWGLADLSNANRIATRALDTMSREQSPNPYEAEYARSLGASFQASTTITNLLLAAPAPQATFPSGQIGDNLRFLAQLIPAFKASGQRRQILLVEWGAFDTHTGQRGSGSGSQDTQLAQLGAALAAFDQALRAAGVGDEVATLVMSEFGRSLKPASGAGTDHSWGNHMMLLGGAVRGGQVHGTLPRLVLGGPDDFDSRAEGRWVPTTSSDQVGAALALWLGMPQGELTSVFPNLANFASPVLPVMA